MVTVQKKKSNDSNGGTVDYSDDSDRNDKYKNKNEGDNDDDDVADGGGNWESGGTSSRSGLTWRMSERALKETDKVIIVAAL